MPYHIKKSGGKFQIVRNEDNKVVGTSDTKAKAAASIRARMAGHSHKSKRPQIR